MYKIYLRMRILLILLVISGIPYQLNAQTSLKNIRNNLTCQCGCNMTIEACGGSMNCQFADNAVVEIEEMIQSGMNTEQILARYVDQYGELVLSAPTKRGFNLVAWILPFVAILAGGYIVVKVLQYWVSQNSHHKTKISGTQDTKNESTYVKKLNDILHALD